MLDFHAVPAGGDKPVWTASEHVLAVADEDQLVRPRSGRVESPPDRRSTLLPVREAHVAAQAGVRVEGGGVPEAEIALSTNTGPGEW